MICDGSSSGQRVSAMRARSFSISASGVSIVNGRIAEVRAFDATHPGTDIDVERIYWSDQPGALLDDHVDISFVHLPINDDGLDLAHLYSLPRLALLPGGHRLARRCEITIRELADDPVIPHQGASPCLGSLP
jgi:DNA-binding transcriptional LysR family regulator